jgi:metal-responsive CopG/Arc/MetJ family transcriptional regulator
METRQDKDMQTVQVRMPKELLGLIDGAVVKAGPEADRSMWIRNACRAAIEAQGKKKANG